MANEELAFSANSNSWFEFNKNGLFGIDDDSTPDALLEISASGSSTYDLFMLSSNDNLDGDRFIVKNNGNLGIGATSPNATFHVSGNMNITQNITMKGPDGSVYNCGPANGGTFECSN